MHAHEAITRGFDDYQKQLAVMPTGCHAPGHPILMADGSIEKVEVIMPGDQVMGPDSTPRTVLTLHRGMDDMFEITPVKGDPFVVNAGHILRLRRTRTGKPHEDKRPWFREISVVDYLREGRTFKHLHKLYRVAVDFANGEVSPRRIDPYILGVLLGDGSLHRGIISVCTPDPEIVAELVRYAQWVGSRVRRQPHPGNKASSYFFKGAELCYSNEYIRVLVAEWGINVRCEYKSVPAQYKTGSQDDRKQLLAGLLDTDGYLGHSGYEYSSRSPLLSDDVVFIARSLGLAAYKAAKIVKGETYYRASLLNHFRKEH